MQQACTNRENAAVIFLWAARRCENLVKTGSRGCFVTGLTTIPQWCCNAPKPRRTTKNVTGSPRIEYLADARPTERRRVVQFWCKKIMNPALANLAATDLRYGRSRIFVQLFTSRLISGPVLVRGRDKCFMSERLAIYCRQRREARCIRRYAAVLSLGALLRMGRR